MDQGIEILIPSFQKSNMFFEENTSNNTKWTSSENKQFENALALFDANTPDRWTKVAAMIPGKTVDDVMKQYKELEDDVSDIEAGLTPIPGYSTCSFTLEWLNNNNHGLDFDKQFYGMAGKRGSIGRGFDQDKKKGVPWTEEEHRQFLMGLRKYGKGNWRNISFNYVTSRTPTQVASHAQKYFIRQLSGGRDKRRSSIHDITESPSINTKKNPSSSGSDFTTQFQSQHNSTLEGQDWNMGSFCGSRVGPCNPVFQMQQQ